MAGYKVSHKVLRQQGEDIKAVAKLVDGYADRVGQIRGKLGSDGLLAEVRSNLQKLQTQLGESRTVLNTAGEFLVKTVESYTGVETRQVKKVDSTRAHNRDFYKNPVVVASAGGAAGGAVAAAAVGTASSAPTPSNTVVNYTDNSVNILSSTSESPSDALASAARPAVNADVPYASGAVPASAKVPSSAAAVGVAAVGGAAVAGAVAGGIHLKKKRDAEKANKVSESLNNTYDPEAELEKAIAHVRALELEEST